MILGVKGLRCKLYLWTQREGEGFKSNKLWNLTKPFGEIWHAKLTILQVLTVRYYKTDHN